MTGTAMTEAEEFHKIYKLEVVVDPDPPADDPRRRCRTSSTARERQVQRGHRRDRRDARGRPAGPRRHGLASRSPRSSSSCSSGAGIKHEVLNAKYHEQEAPIVAQAGRTRGGHDRHEHGRPRHRHQARRQPGRAGLARSSTGGASTRPRCDKATYDEALAEAKADLRRGPRAGRRGRRAAHHRHRAPREPAHRQPAPRPRRPPGRPGLLAVLPLARRRPHEALRLATGCRA